MLFRSDSTKTKTETHIGAGNKLLVVVAVSDLVEEGLGEDVVALTAPDVDVEAAFVDASNGIPMNITSRS